MSEISAIMYGQKVNKYCAKCGKAIVYGQNGAMISEYCFECKPITYHCAPSTVNREVDWDELDALEDRCLREEDI